MMQEKTLALLTDVDNKKIFLDSQGWNRIIHAVVCQVPDCLTLAMTSPPQSNLVIIGTRYPSVYDREEL